MEFADINDIHFEQRIIFDSILKVHTSEIPILDLMLTDDTLTIIAIPSLVAILMFCFYYVKLIINE